MLDLESLLAPIADDAPCGSDLQYDPAFLELETAGAGKPERQYGDTVIAAEIGASLTLRSQPGQGTRVTLSFRKPHVLLRAA